jgi:hypothetical protein
MPRLARLILAIAMVGLGLWLAIAYSNKCHIRDTEPLAGDFFTCRR